MLYSAYQWQSDLADPLHRVAEQAKVLLQPFKGLPGLSAFAASWEMFSRAKLTHHRPQYRISRVMVGNRAVIATQALQGGWSMKLTPLSVQQEHHHEQIR